jgi:HlyD family secretion protein
VILTGTIGPGKTVAALAPFDGVIRERRAQIGAPVHAGDILVVMDAGEIEGRLREAQAAFLKSSMAISLLEKWDTSPEVIRARRAQEAADASLAVIERQVAETRKLLDRGIVSRNEYDGLVQQRDTLRNGATGSRLDLQSTLERGSADNRRLADLELLNAKSRLSDLQGQVDGSVVRAPVDGIITRPPVNTPTPQVSPTIEAGARVTRGQAIFSIADTETLVVTGKVDEVDVNRLRIGQPVKIGGDAFPGAPIPGRIVGISAEADAGLAAGRTPSFEVRAAFPGDAGPHRDRIRIGMSARMQIEIASNPQAIVVPIEAVRDPLTNPTVSVRDPRSGMVGTRNVTLGATTERGVEILTGLEAGEVVIIPEP